MAIREFYVERGIRWQYTDGVVVPGDGIQWIDCRTETSDKIEAWHRARVKVGWGAAENPLSIGGTKEIHVIERVEGTLIYEWNREHNTHRYVRRGVVTQRIDARGLAAYARWWHSFRAW